MEADIERLLTENAALKELIEGEVQLERRFGLDSSNSGKPPSSDGLKGPARAPESLLASSWRLRRLQIPTTPATALLGQLLLGEQLTGVAIPVARVAGIALIALGIACWPAPPLVGMLTYSTIVTLYLAYLGFAGGLTGVLLWPAVALHVVLSILLGGAWCLGFSSSAPSR